MIASGVAAQAATLTIDFTGISSGTDVDLGGGFVADFFVADDLRIVNGNCDSTSGRPCAALNVNDVTTITRDSGDSFKLTSYWYQLLGDKAELEVSFLDASGGTLGSDAFSAPVDGNNDDGHVVAGSFLADIWGIRFDNPGRNPGNVRFDDINLSYTVAAVPLPAAGWMLLAGLGGLAAASRRKKA